MKKLIRFHIKNLSPGMLQNPATPELLNLLRTGDRKQKKTDWTIEEEARTKLYRSEKGLDESPGKMGVPMQNIISAMVIAGQSVKVGKKNLSTAKATRVFEFLEFVEDFCPFAGTDKDGNVPWNPFPVKGTMHNGASEVAVCITRPRIPHWELSFTVKYDDSRQVPQDAIVKLVEIAGRQVGLGDWRPQKKGRFGRFVITKVEVLPLDEKEEKAEVMEYTPTTAPKEMLALAEA